MKIERVRIGGYRITNPPNFGMCWGAALAVGMFLARLYFLVFTSFQAVLIPIGFGLWVCKKVHDSVYKKYPYLTKVEDRVLVNLSKQDVIDLKEFKAQKEQREGELIERKTGTRD